LLILLEVAHAPANLSLRYFGYEPRLTPSNLSLTYFAYKPRLTPEMAWSLWWRTPAEDRGDIHGLTTSHRGYTAEEPSWVSELVRTHRWRVAADYHRCKPYTPRLPETKTNRNSRSWKQANSRKTTAQARLRSHGDGHCPRHGTKSMKTSLTPP
jgi:hypothetical protein